MFPTLPPLTGVKENHKKTVTYDVSMGLFFAKVQAQRFDSDELKQCEKQGILVLLTSASLEVFGEGMWQMWGMYCRP